MLKIKEPYKRIKSVGLLAILAVFVFSIISYLYKPHAHAQIFLTSGTTWTVPSDWSSSNNTIELIGGGGGGGVGGTGSGTNDGGGAGGGGSYARITNANLSPGSTVGISIGSAGTGGTASAQNGNSGGNTFLCSSTTSCSTITDTSVIVGAVGGVGGSNGAGGGGGAGGAGGNSASNVGATNYSGGGGGTGASVGGNSGGGGGGGGGAAGTNGAGNTGGNGSGTTGSAGGQGDVSSGGAGGGTNGGTGGNGTEYDSTHGSGGGGGGGQGASNSNGLPGGAGGQYGAGGGGGSGSKRSTWGNGADGVQGLIRVNYTYTSQLDYRWRLDDGNETTGTSLAAQDTAASINYGTNVRLRLSLGNLGSSSTFSYRLEYAPYIGSCGTWTAIPVTATTEAFNIYNSANITDQAATTNASSGPGVITDPAGYTFTAGKFVKNTSNTATAQTIGAGNFTELEYAIQPNTNATQGSYCFRITTSAGTPLDSYKTYPILNINYPPSTPTIYSVLDSTTNVPRLPIFQLRSLDYNYDPIKYVVEVCAANSWPCSSGAITYDQTSSQTCWTGQNASSSTAYASDTQLYNSTMAYCDLQPASILAPNTTYYMRAKAIDPSPGSGIYSSYSTVVSFTTGALAIQINGGVCIGGTGGSTCSSGSGSSITGVKIGG